MFAELRRIVSAPGVRAGLELLAAHGLLAAVLPELEALRGVQQSEYHHADVYEHTLEVLEQVVAMEADPASVGLGEVAGPVAALLAEPLADELTRGDAMRFAALLHDAAKPQTRGEAGGRVTFVGHDREGAQLARTVLRRLRTSERLAAYVASLTAHHLRLGFLVHERPLSRRSIWRYLVATSPNAADVTLLTVADRLATRGRKAEPAIAAHVELARRDARARVRPARGGPAAAAGAGRPAGRARSGSRPGPELGALLAQLEEDRYAGDVRTPEEAIERARELREGRGQGDVGEACEADDAGEACHASTAAS